MMTTSTAIATLAEIKQHIQPIVSKWAAKFDLETKRRKYDEGELSWWGYRPKRGYKDWIRIRSDKKLHIFELAIDADDKVKTEYTVATTEFAKDLEKIIERKFHQKVPVNIVQMTTYKGTVTSGESSSTMFRGEMVEDDETEWF
jgi:hypothetical protein